MMIRPLGRNYCQQIKHENYTLYQQVGRSFHKSEGIMWILYSIALIGIGIIIGYFMGAGI